MGDLKKFDPSYLTFVAGVKGVGAKQPVSRYYPRQSLPVTEHLIQLLWRNGLYNKNTLITTNGLQVTIIKPGRLNRSAGPDFKNAKIILGRQTKVGDVEIHINSEEWCRHNHHLSRLYNQTILHVFINRGVDARPAITRSGRVIPELELGLYLRHPFEELRIEIEESERPLTGRADNPPCRNSLLSKGHQGIYDLLDKIGDGRMLIKSNRLMERLDGTDADQVLYELFFECLGYSRFKKQFGRIARHLPFKKLRELFLINADESQAVTAQGSFFTVSGLLDTAKQISDDVGLKELLNKLKSLEYKGLKRVINADKWQLGGCRPANYPHRRVAAFSHLVSTDFGADYYRKNIVSLPPKATERECRKFVRNLLNTFSTVSDTFWDNRYTFNRVSRRRKRLIGKDRGISLVVDCLIPFFLAISRTEDDPELEQRLLAIYCSVPKPSSNTVIDFMERNLFGRHPKSLIKSVRHQQALIQLYNDFCYTAPGGCSGCNFHEYLSSTTGEPVKQG